MLQNAERNQRHHQRAVHFTLACMQLLHTSCRPEAAFLLMGTMPALPSLD